MIIKSVTAWHVVGDKLRDGRPVPRDGEMLRFIGRPVICKRGLHASLSPWDALYWAPDNVLCLVECGGTILHQPDKLVCTERTIVARMDAKPLLRYFACQQALSVVHLWDPPDVVLDFLMGDEAARAAARAWARAWAGAGAAARAAAATWAAMAAAWAATWAATGARAWATAANDFDRLVYECFSDFVRMPASLGRSRS